MILEACVNSAMSALEAVAGGAHRVELCENMHDGGTTPGAGMIRFLRSRMTGGLFVMIRPRGGDFLYSNDEFEVMLEEIRTAREMGADGVVFGILQADGTVDLPRMSRLMSEARPLSVTFHRAFDMTSDPFRALYDLIGLGVDRILTSGQKPDALSGSALIAELIRHSAGRVVIMPGGGIKEHNLAEVARRTGAQEFHVRLDRQMQSGMQFIRPDLRMGHPDRTEFEYTVTDRDRVQEAVRILSNIRTSRAT